MPVKIGENAAKIFLGDAEIAKGYIGDSVFYDKDGFKYELIAEVAITANTNFVDFNNLTQKDKGSYLLKYDITPYQSGEFSIFANGDFNAGNYHFLRFAISGNQVSRFRALGNGLNNTGSGFKGYMFIQNTRFNNFVAMSKSTQRTFSDVPEIFYSNVTSNGGIGALTSIRFSAPMGADSTLRLFEKVI